MTEADVVLALLLIAGFALLGALMTWGWARNAAETRGIREAVEAWVLWDIARRREEERAEVRPPEDLRAYLAEVMARLGDGASGEVRVLEVSPTPGDPAFQIRTDRGDWILTALPPPKGRRALSVDALSTGDRWAAERLRRARAAAGDGVVPPPVERWWLIWPEPRPSLSAWRASLRRPMFRLSTLLRR